MWLSAIGEPCPACHRIYRLGAISPRIVEYPARQRLPPSRRSINYATPLGITLASQHLSCQPCNAASLMPFHSPPTLASNLLALPGPTPKMGVWLDMGLPPLISPQILQTKPDHLKEASWDGRVAQM